MSVLLKEQDFYDLALAYFRKAHEQNIVYAEVFFDPQAHTSRGLPFATVIEGIHRAQQDAEAELGLRTQLIMCFLRDHSAESARRTLDESLPYKNWIVGRRPRLRRARQPAREVQGRLRARRARRATG